MDPAEEEEAVYSAKAEKLQHSAEVLSAQVHSTLWAYDRLPWSEKGNTIMLILRKQVRQSHYLLNVFGVAMLD